MVTEFSCPYSGDLGSKLTKADQTLRTFGLTRQGDTRSGKILNSSGQRVATYNRDAQAVHFRVDEQLLSFPIGTVRRVICKFLR